MIVINRTPSTRDAVYVNLMHKLNMMQSELSGFGIRQSMRFCFVLDYSYSFECTLYTTQKRSIGDSWHQKELSILDPYSRISYRL
jgi:hypothetical protein